MSITWVHPAALAGLALIALPIAIHLLVRQQTRPLPFPSLRFLRPTALAALRRRAIQDAPLLLCRIAVIAAAATALAGPVLRSESRKAEYANRISRATIVLGSGEAEPTSTDAFREASFSRPAIADAIGDALRWLEAQPPSALEVVFSGPFHRGAISEGDLAAVPAGVGIRLVPGTPAAAPNPIAAPFLTRRDGALVRVDQRIDVDTDSTRVSDGPAVTVPDDRLRVVAAPADQALAEAALGAALDEGVPWTAGDRRMLIVWEGADAAAVRSPGAALVRMPVPNPESAARAIWNAIDRATPRAFVDPVLIPAEQLQSWSRPPGEPSPNAIPMDEGDRRWLWGTALALLGVEYLLRRARAPAGSTGTTQAEARVA